ncbi:MAG: polysaccharide deacetylase family protein [Bryobacterales bacterium]|nr:polysaccharide deacetylase family protein [Bryobacterales bacterium]
MSLRTPARGTPVILTYHSIDDSGSVISVSPAQFRRHMEILAAKRIRVVPLTEVRDTPGAVALTFDDGYENFLTHAAPVLAEYGLPATVFPVSGYCGRDNGWPTQPAFVPRLPLMGWRALERVVAQGIGIGAHSATHPFLTRVPDEQVREELSGCRASLEARLGVTADTLVYPYGDSDARVRRLAAEVFRLACGTRLGFLSPGDHCFDLPRIDAYYVRDSRWFGRLFSRSGRSYVAMRRWVRGLRGGGSGGGI